MEEGTILNNKELKRIKVMELLSRGSLTNQQAADLLGLGKRQIIRLKGRYLAYGDEGLVHGNKGRVSDKKISDENREKVIELFNTKYFDFNFSHFTEKLKEREGMDISRPSVSRILSSVGIKSKRSVKRRGKLHRSRPRRAAAGMLWQTDATTFEWFGVGKGYATLHAYIDDATGEVVGAFFTENECTLGYVEALKQGIEKYGMPFDIYSDRHTIFRSPVEGNMTNFGIGLEELGIGQIFALSPQAKGRIERLWGTFQDRLPGEFRLLGINSIEQANSVLPEILKEHNARYAVQAEEDDVYVKICEPVDFNMLFAHREERKTDSGGNISYKGKKYKPLSNSRKLSSRRVEVRETLNGKIYILLDGLDGEVLVEMQEMKAPVKKSEKSQAGKVAKESKPAASLNKKRHLPPATSHPWRHSPVGKSYQDYINTGRKSDVFIEHSR